MRQKTTKKCPRCGEKCLLSQVRCNECGLVFSKLKFASNKEAKKNIISRQKDKVIYTNQLPADVNSWTLIILAACLGWMGAHSYYVGKYIKGAFSSICVLVTWICLFFPYEAYGPFYNWFFFPVGISVLMWGWDCINIIIKRYKVPISIRQSEIIVEDKKKGKA